MNNIHEQPFLATLLSNQISSLGIHKATQMPSGLFNMFNMSLSFNSVNIFGLFFNLNALFLCMCNGPFSERMKNTSVMMLSYQCVFEMLDVCAMK